jgi:hypothetical protein
MPANTYGRQVVEALVNKTGGAVVAGDVVIIDTANDGAFTTTTTARSEVTIGVVQETIASNATGRVLLSGYAALVNVPASVTRGHFVETHTVAKQATGNSARRSGSFGQFRTGGTTPTAVLWGSADQTASGGAASGLLAVNQYAPATTTIFSTTSATRADVDATNMVVTFTAPASGNVLVRLSTWADIGTANVLYFSLRESTSNLGYPVMVLRGATQQVYAAAAIYLTGVSAGSHTYKWAFATDGTGTAGRIIVGQSAGTGTQFGPGVMEVWAAP